MAGTAHVCYGHAAGEMLTTVSVWRAPELARGPLSPAILSLSLFLLLEGGGGGGDKTEKRRKFEISNAAAETESGEFQFQC